MLDDLRMGVRFARDFRAFLGRTYTAEDCQQLLKDQLARRDESFLRIMARAVFENARSPYFALMRHAKVQYADMAASVRRHGVEGALADLYEAGVHVTLEEFKGRRPIRRPGLDLSVRDRDFDNPLLTAHYEGQSGGSRGVGTRTRVDLGLLAHEAASDLIALAALDAVRRPMGIWRPALPVSAAMKSVLRHARIGILAERWFSQSEFRFSRHVFRHWLFTRYSLAMSRRWGRPLPTPEHTPLSQAITVARWLAQKKAHGTPAYLDAGVSAAVRVCLAARQHGLDIAGTLFRVGSEPFTEARARIIAGAGCQVLCHYHLAEVGRLGVACLKPTAVDEVHVVTDKIALLQRERSASGETVGALFCTTLHPAAPKIMVNVELGDYGVLGERGCGCPFDHLGFRHHLHTIRSYEKLTSEGMHFVGSELLRLVEEVLPDRFGGHPTDYQVLEEEEGGLSKVSLVVSPRVGAVDEAQVINAALEVLGSAPGSTGADTMMAGYWRDAQTLRVVRREPYATSVAKILPLHVIGRRERLS
jgi:hypothetical protein